MNVHRSKWCEIER